jgi:general stress protein 26
MKKIVLFLLLSITGYGSIQGQSGSGVDSSDALMIKAAREVMTSVSYCALITLDAKGTPCIRAMDPFKPENDMTVWLGTNPKSRKVQQIKSNSRVTLYYLNTDGSGYVTIYGHAKLINDPVEKQARWKNEWEAFYPDRSESYMLIKVIPDSLELISYAHGISGDPVTWTPPSAKFLKQ